MVVILAEALLFAVVLFSSPIERALYGRLASFVTNGNAPTLNSSAEPDEDQALADAGSDLPETLPTIDPLLQGQPHAAVIFEQDDKVDSN